MLFDEPAVSPVRSDIPWLLWRLAPRSNLKPASKGSSLPAIGRVPKEQSKQGRSAESAAMQLVPKFRWGDWLATQQEEGSGKSLYWIDSLISRTVLQRVGARSNALKTSCLGAEVSHP